MAQNKDLETVALLPVKKVRLTGAIGESAAFWDLWSQHIADVDFQCSYFREIIWSFEAESYFCKTSRLFVSAFLSCLGGSDKNKS